MKLKVLFSFILFLSLQNAFANLQSLAKDFLLNNSEVKVAESRVELANLNLKSFEFSRNTSFNFESNRNENKLESFSAFAAQFAGGAFRLPIESNSYSLGISRAFSWGGNASIANQYQEITAQGARKIYGFTQRFSYSQNLSRDFFGKNFSLEKDALSFNIESTKARSENEVQGQLFNLVQTYYNAALQKALVKLQSEAKSRAGRRLNLIKKRVKDGLREKVDFIQAEISFYRSEESVKTAQQNLAAAIEGLSTSVHRKVTDEDVVSLISEKFKLRDKPLGEANKNHNLKALSEQLKVAKADLKRAKLNLLPDITLDLAANNNNFDPEAGDAFSDGRLGGPNREFSVGLNLSWALGGTPQAVEETRALVNLKTNEIQLEKLGKNVLQTEKSIKNQISLLDTNLDSSKKRMTLAGAALKEYNRLYARGRADLDQLIRAEETLINTEINHVQYLSQREILVHSLAFLYGNLRQFLVRK